MNDEQPSVPWENPHNTIETGARGLTTHNDRVMMLNIRPEEGSGRLIPYSRIEEVEVNKDATRITLYATHSVVTITGEKLDAVIIAVQRAVAWSLHIGQSTSNDVVIEDIQIALASDNGSA